jgi:tetrahedral aminopeptidase
MDKDAISKVLQRLVATDGVSGSEAAVRKVVAEEVAGFVDEVRSDVMGSLIAVKKGSPHAPGRLMIAAHLDEIGLAVTKVDRGFLHVTRVGGVDPRNLVAQEVTVYPTGAGSELYPDGIPGFIGTRPPHVLSQEERNQVLPMEALRVDLGLRSPAPGEALSGLGARLSELVQIGDRVVVRGPYTELLNGRVATKSLDNRASVAAMIGALGYLQGLRPTWDVYAVATSQEEVGVRGAWTSAFGIAPDIAVVVDVTFGIAHGSDESETVEMDKGPAIGWGPNLHPGLVRALRESADAIELAYVTEPIPGSSGTDAWAIQVVQAGIPCALLSIPIRYMHSPTELVVLQDIDRTARLLATFVSRLDDHLLARLPEEV